MYNTYIKQNTKHAQLIKMPTYVRPQLILYFYPYPYR